MIATGEDSKKVEDKDVVNSAHFVTKKIFAENYSENVDGQVKLYGGHQIKSVNGKEKLNYQNKKDVANTLKNVLEKNVKLQKLYVIGEENQFTQN